MLKQLEITSIVEAANRETVADVHRYMRRHRALYLDFARHNTPRLSQATHIWERFAFAILTANTEVHNAVRAFNRARKLGGLPNVRGLPGIEPRRAEFVNALPTDIHGLSLLLRQRETWHEYRMRLALNVEGLALTKASYAACLLYPLEADVACLDVWMQRFFSGARTFEWLRERNYVEMENKLRPYARKHHVSLALAQWMIWDWLRTGSPTSQRFFDQEGERT